MAKRDKPLKTFRTLRGFIKGDEPDEENYFAYSASLRIFGDSLDFTAINTALGVEPSFTYRKGEKKGPRSSPNKFDMWNYSPRLDESQPLHAHIDLLWSKISHAKGFLLSLKSSATVDIFLGYRSNMDTAGIEIPYASLEPFRILQIPFGLSIIIT